MGGVHLLLNFSGSFFQLSTSKANRRQRLPIKESLKKVISLSKVPNTSVSITTYLSIHQAPPQMNRFQRLRILARDGKHAIVVAHGQTYETKD